MSQTIDDSGLSDYGTGWGVMAPSSAQTNTPPTTVTGASDGTGISASSITNSLNGLAQLGTQAAGIFSAFTGNAGKATTAPTTVTGSQPQGSGASGAMGGSNTLYIVGGVIVAAVLGFLLFRKA